MNTFGTSVLFVQPIRNSALKVVEKIFLIIQKEFYDGGLLDTAPVVQTKPSFFHTCKIAKTEKSYGPMVGSIWFNHPLVPHIIRCGS